MSGRARRGLVRVAWSHRDVRTLLVAVAASQTAAWLFGVALVVYAFQETRSAAWVAAATILRTLPSVLFGTFAGDLGDRYERRTVLAASHLTAGGCLLVIAVAVAAGGGMLVAVLGLAFLAATAKTPAGPAEAAKPAATSGRRRPRASATAFRATCSSAKTTSGWVWWPTSSTSIG